MPEILFVSSCVQLVRNTFISLYLNTFDLFFIEASLTNINNDNTVL